MFNCLLLDKRQLDWLFLIRKLSHWHYIPAGLELANIYTVPYVHRNLCIIVLYMHHRSIELEMGNFVHQEERTAHQQFIIKVISSSNLVLVQLGGGSEDSSTLPRLRPCSDHAVVWTVTGTWSSQCQSVRKSSASRVMWTTGYKSERN